MIQNGIDRVEVWKKLLSGSRIGVLTHAPAVTQNYERNIDLLCRHVNVTTLWGPEHGFDGVAQAGAAVSGSRDAASGLPVYSLHGGDGPSFAETLKRVDVVVCDFCDIGTRFYTYASTMADSMAACAKARKPFVVLDRPNPVNGVICEGTLLEKEFASFVGRYPIPVRHGLTIGETARVFNARFGIGADLTVIPVTGWKRSMEFEDWGRVWINPSPNMPSADCARIYAGTCFLEGTNISEGRGTTRPYEIIGAPFVNPRKLAESMQNFHLPGIAVRPCFFKPAFSKYAAEPCGGIQIMVTDRKQAPCFEFGIRLLDVLRNMCPEFSFEGHETFFDHLMGTDRFRTGKESADDLIRRAREESRLFQKQNEPLNLYE